MTAWDPTSAPIWLSAYKHDVEAEDIRHALRNCVRMADLDSEVVLYLGADRAGRLIEVGARSDAEGIWVVHAMRPARPHRFEQGR